MSLVTCPACEQTLPGDIPACVRCGHPLPQAAIETEAPAGLAASEAGELHAMALQKLALLSFFSLGLYQLYWFYRNWTRVRERTGRRLMPFWRSFFAPLWSYSLFDEVAEQARAGSVAVAWSPMVLAIAFFLISAAWRFPGPGTIATLFSFVPLLPVQATINAMAERRGVRPDARIGRRHVVLIAAGAVLAILAAIGASTMPPPAP
ncbi:hypothetical protein [Longimicrobium sp.]|uniref:hypothetical protein n=1 Tax=Longimicrobium sp. TaxID=2029185 RepID=UPI002C7F42FD|nr:hypothetical protein [Longimicrobium sp.]HSU13565.1 hypothetical protein [Longimicrobium sp.]